MLPKSRELGIGRNTLRGAVVVGAAALMVMMPAESVNNAVLPPATTVEYAEGFTDVPDPVLPQQSGGETASAE